MSENIEEIYYAVVRVDYNENKSILEGKIKESEKAQKLEYWKNRIANHHQTPYLMPYTQNGKKEIFKDYRDGFENL